ncbi:uncharacterized protein N7498_000826 [Penicillium cinerascens]|uniref:Uncharacterized protein n=1 Tax=Penicillium cinerascens TaxID=70096 RepID=A0A9W9NF31_9EURO|nr:uncharacterized protein N7498_000826 [Penicillium cinerascens]KAJ5218727.1 hypothetical protein N7498_000826 [Penicillium cinerascens]
MANIGYEGLKVLIGGPDGSVEPTYSVSFDAQVADICFSEWIGRLNPVRLDRHYDISVRKYPAWLPGIDPKFKHPPLLMCLRGSVNRFGWDQTGSEAFDVLYTEERATYSQTGH